MLNVISVSNVYLLNGSNRSDIADEHIHDNIYIPIQSLKQQQEINGATLTIDDTHEANEATTAVASPIHRRTIFPFRFFSFKTMWARFRSSCLHI